MNRDEINISTRIFESLDAAEAAKAEAIFPLVYDELRKLAAFRVANEAAGHSLQATALVHEAFLRVQGGDGESRAFCNKRYFFAAAAEAMRRILIDRARRRGAKKRGGDFDRLSLEAASLSVDASPELIFDLEAALSKLEKVEPRQASLVRLRFYTGLTVAQAAATLGIATRTAEGDWTYARAWLYRELSDWQE
ncbi:MAG: ECF-type sigma factor [Phycisphaerae bacterium]